MWKGWISHWTPFPPALLPPPLPPLYLEAGMAETGWVVVTWFQAVTYCGWFPAMFSAGWTCSLCHHVCAFMRLMFFIWHGFFQHEADSGWAGKEEREKNRQTALCAPMAIPLRVAWLRTLMCGWQPVLCACITPLYSSWLSPSWHRGRGDAGRDARKQPFNIL